MQNTQVKLALIQMCCSSNPEENLKKALKQIEIASQNGARIICLQELFQSLYFCQSNEKVHFNLAESIPGLTTDKLSMVAKKQGVVIVASLFEKTVNKQFYNTAVIIDADGLLKNIYRKIHIPDDLLNHYSELYYFTPGDLALKAVQTRFAKIGVLVCWDQWFPEAARTLANDGAQIIFYPTAIGWQLSQQNTDIGNSEYDAWLTIQRAHAIANGIFIAACNRTGKEGHINFWGGSFVADPIGVVQAKASHDREEILFSSCDLSRIELIRKDWPFLTCRRTDIY